MKRQKHSTDGLCAREKFHKCNEGQLGSVRPVTEREGTHCASGREDLEERV